jgi:ParB-like chromosome segregation protein Spo0J
MPNLPRSAGPAQEIRAVAFHPFADIFPMMDDAALAELAADIKAESQREPIHLWQGKIIDGRNRYAACKIAGVEPVIKSIEFPGGDAEALAYVVSRNLKRRHLNAPQRTEVIRKLRELPQWRDASNREIARQIGVDEATVRRAGLSAASAADAPRPHTVTVKRGEQEYRMRVEAKPTPELVPLTFEDSKRIAAAGQEKELRASERYRERREAALAALTPVVMKPPSRRGSRPPWTASAAPSRSRRTTQLRLGRQSRRPGRTDLRVPAVTAAAAFALAQAHGVDVVLDGGKIAFRSRGFIPPDVLASLRSAAPDMLAALRQAKPSAPTGAPTSDELLEVLRARGFVIKWRGDRGGAMPPLRDVVAKHQAFFRRLLTWRAPSSPPVRT